MIDTAFDPTQLLTSGIALNEQVVIDFLPGTDGVLWGTLHCGRHAIEIGTVRGPSDVASVLTMTAGVLIERYGYADGVYVSDEGDERWVLIGCWILNARMCLHPNHLHLGSPTLARAVFNRRAGIDA